MKEVNIAKVEGGYIVRTNTETTQVISIHPNFGSAVKVIRTFFDESVVKSEVAQG